MSGRRIVAYLQDGRPASVGGRTVFVRRAGPAPGVDLQCRVTTVVACAPGGGPAWAVIGAHRLRHSAATAMLRAGGSLTEIGQVLRHAAR